MTMKKAAHPAKSPPPINKSTEAVTVSIPPQDGAARNIEKATRFDVGAWILLAAGLLVTISYHLTSSLIAGLFVYSLVHRITVHLKDYRVTRNWPKMAALLVVAPSRCAVYGNRSSNDRTGAGTSRERSGAFA